MSTVYAPAKLNTASSLIAANVALTLASTPYQVTSLSLGIGTWLVVGRCEIKNTGGGDYSVRITTGGSVASGVISGDTVASEVQQGLAANFEGIVNVQALLVLAATTTVNLVALAGGTGATVYADPPTGVNSAGVHGTSGLYAVQVG